MTTTLYYRQGTSDKVYQTSIVPSGSGYLVTCTYGRRGNTPTSGQKTPQPVSFADAQAIYQKLIREKQSKGYTQDSSGTPLAVMTKPLSSPAKAAPVNLPMLLNSIDVTTLEQLLNNDHWCVQEKHDGKRITIHTNLTTVTAYNKRGLPCSIPQPIADACLALDHPSILDGECVGDIFHAFDLLMWNGQDYRHRSYSTRFNSLYQALTDDGGNCQKHLQCVECEDGMTGDKTEFYNALRDRNAEGIVLKHLHAPWQSSRPATGGNALKFKFVETASCIVLRQNDKASVALGLLDSHGRTVPVGNVTIPPNATIPPPMTLCEVRYLYAYPGGSLYQPVYLGPRDDITRLECTLTQLKLKAA